MTGEPESGDEDVVSQARPGHSALDRERSAATAKSVLARADSPLEPKDKLDEDSRKIDLARKEADLRLSKVVGYGALMLMAAQLTVADSAFFLYGEGNAWKIPAAVINAWLAAVVIEVIGVVLVITRYLFPSGSERRG